MSRHYLLDGYNLIKQAPRLADLSLQEGREALIRWIQAARPQGSLQNLVTVVFDGNSDHFGSMASGAIKVVFANESADEFIKEVIDHTKDKKKFVVVSDDKGITLYVRAQGANILSVKVFAAELFGSKTRKIKRGDKNDASPKYISDTQTKKINSEFEKLWLK